MKKKTLYMSMLLMSIVTLYLGLNFKGHDFHNGIVIGEDNLKFVDRSLGVLELGFSDYDVYLLNKFGFIVSMEIELESSNSRRTRHLLRFLSDSNADSDINFFFWKNQLIINLGDDYDYKKRHPRIGLNLQEKKYLLDVVFTKYSISLYVDKKRIKEIKIIDDYLNFNSDSYRVIFGGHLLTQKSWSGNMYMFSISAITDKVHSDMLGAGVVKPLQRYVFDNPENNYYVDSINGNKFVLPKYPVLGQRVLLRKKSFSDVLSISTKVDIVVNLCWFMLLSGVFYIGFVNCGFSPRVGFMGSLVVSISFGFIIEGFQSWLPMRDSNIRDLVLNVAGGLLGAAAMYLISFNDCIRNKLVFS